MGPLPWRAFWAAYVFALTFPPPFTPGPLHASLVLSACMLVAMYLSAVQGLRVSWRRSPAGGVLVLFGGFVIGALSSVLRLQHTGEWHRLDLMALAWFLAVAYWALMACVADRVARRLAIETPAAPGP